MSQLRYMYEPLTKTEKQKTSSRLHISPEKVDDAHT